MTEQAVIRSALHHETLLSAFSPLVFFCLDVIVVVNASTPSFQNADASYDFSSNDPFPFPRYTDDWFNR